MILWRLDAHSKNIQQLLNVVQSMDRVVIKMFWKDATMMVE